MRTFGRPFEYATEEGEGKLRKLIRLFMNVYSLLSRPMRIGRPEPIAIAAAESRMHDFVHLDGLSGRLAVRELIGSGLFSLFENFENIVLRICHFKHTFDNNISPCPVTPLIQSHISVFNSCRTEYICCPPVPISSDARTRLTDGSGFALARSTVDEGKPTIRRSLTHHFPRGIVHQ